ncbi:MAG: putative bifunctional diguanylate cyclase/phosphodiesterase [Methyloligellaceae bacterium]
MVLNSWQIARDREESLLKAASANSELIEANKQIKKMAMRDPLTELANREAFLENLEARIKNRKDEKFAVFLLDLDNFKNVNDSIGHGAGDELLRIVTERLIKAVRNTDIVARLGGDEFALIIDIYDNEKMPSIVADRILSNLVAPVLIEAALIHPNASIGIALYPDHAHSALEFIRLADIALHAAKKSGRGRYRIYDTRMAVSLARVDEIEIALRQALSEQQMQLYYQPKVDIRTGAIMGAEALLRWFVDNTIKTSTIDLFDVAEERGMVPQISSFVFGRAAEDILKLQSMELMIRPISINIHPFDLKTPELLMERLKSMMNSGVKKSDIILEVTEGCFVGRGSDEATHILDTINEMGIKLSLDDFGTGHAALSHLKRLPVSELKVDREFINGICHDRRDQAITMAALEITRCLEIDCVAEGIETEQQAEALRKMDHQNMSLIGQGYLWAKPMPFNEFIHFLEQQRKDGLLPTENISTPIKLQGTQ